MNHAKYLILFISVTSMVSCKKGFLDLPDNSNLNRQSYVKDLKSLQEYANGIYPQLSVKYEIGVDAAYPGLIADELKVSSLTRPLAIHNNWSQVASASQTDTRTSKATTMNGSWMNLYSIIRSCNFVIETIDQYSSENTEKANDIKGQALALRALLHLRLANFFAQHYSFTADGSHLGVPYITASDITKPYNRQTVAEVYNNLIRDVEAAISLMHLAITDTRYMNRQAAQALLARIYLYKGDYIRSKEIAIDLISQRPLMSITAGYPIDVFKFKESAARTEVFFQITPVYQEPIVYSEFLGAYFAANYYRATSDIATALTSNKNDIRNTWVTQSGSNWKVTKFPPGVAGGLGSDPSVDYYVPVFRVSEMFLIAAEASAKTNDETSAQLYLNALRKRADPTLTDITPTGAALLDSIYNERRKELCFEGFRMWDLQRWKQGVHRKDVLLGYQTDLPYPSDKAIAPIPGQDVKLMRLQQNSGY